MLSFDIGANIGKWTLANCFKFDKIIAVEASPDTYNELQRNMAMLNINNCVCLNYAVCDNDNKDVTFYIAQENTLSSLNKDWFHGNSRFNNTKYYPITCKSITLDKLIELYGIPDLIKIDVECGEFQTISSLSTKTPLLCFEWASETYDIIRQCLDKLYTLGYRQFHIQYQDEYTYIPQESAYISLDNVIAELEKTTPKEHWGMIWAK